ncbi:MAG: hypothetical protein ACQGVC_12385 [Myxococcota bacterium]
MLAAMLSAFAVWHLAHAHAHARAHDAQQGAAVVASQASPGVALQAVHEHGHEHPDLPPVLPAGKIDPPAAVAAVSASSDAVAGATSFRRAASEPQVRRVLHRTGPSGPRAPPTV